MKISIITLHRVYNYGSVFQAYATQEFFKKLGCDAEIIDYITPERTKKKMLYHLAVNSYNNNIISRAFYRILKLFSIFLKELTFGRFVRKHLNLTRKYITAEDLENDPPKADIYVTGSDQTWNSDYNQGIDRGFFLDFIPEEAVRIAYVASFGKDSLDDEEKEITSIYLKRYDAISVRENTAVNILSGMGFMDVEQLIDPTLQFNKDFWLKLASKRLVKERYVILMLLYNEDNGATEYARKIADEKGMKLIKISWELTRPKMVDKLYTHRTPYDFLSLFYYADFVVTNSFHGLAFSINLGKQFIVVPRNRYNSRIESLLKLTDLESRLVHSEEESMAMSNVTIDYVPVNEILDKERKRAAKFVECVIF